MRSVGIARSSEMANGLPKTRQPTAFHPTVSSAKGSSLGAELRLLAKRLGDGVLDGSAAQVLGDHPAAGIDEESGGNAGNAVCRGKLRLRPFAKEALNPF